MCNQIYYSWYLTTFDTLFIAYTLILDRYLLTLVGRMWKHVWGYHRAMRMCKSKVDIGQMKGRQ